MGKVTSHGTFYTRSHFMFIRGTSFVTGCWNSESDAVASRNSSEEEKRLPGDILLPRRFPGIASERSFEAKLSSAPLLSVEISCSFNYLFMFCFFLTDLVFKCLRSKCHLVQRLIDFWQLFIVNT